MNSLRNGAGNYNCAKQGINFAFWPEQVAANRSPEQAWAIDAAEQNWRALERRSTRSAMKSDHFFRNT
jgi:hypothetical protein